MANKKQTYFVLSHKDQKLKILSVLERKKDNSLIIFPSVAEKYTEIEQGNINADEPISSQKYSIHNSDNSELGNNYIHHTINHPDGRTKESRIVTRALKNGLYIPLFSARAQDLSGEQYVISKKPKHNYIELGDYMPKSSTLYYMLVVSTSKLLVQTDDFNIKSVKFNRYWVSIFWSFGLIPSYSVGRKTHFMTVNEPKLEQKLSYGYEPIEIVSEYKFLRYRQHIGYIDFLAKTLNVTEESKLLKSIGFKKKANDLISKRDINQILFSSAMESYLFGQKLAKSYEIKKALKVFDHSLNLFLKLDLKIEVGHLKNSKAAILQFIGEVDCALEIFDELIDLYRRNNLSFELARSHLNKSIVYRDMGKSLKAIQSAQEALSISSSEKHQVLLPEIQQELGILFRHRGEINKAKDALESAIVNFKESENEVGYAFCSADLGHIAHQEKHLNDALKYYSEALKIFLRKNHPLGIANEKANIGSVFCTMGEKKKGLSYLEEALKLHKLIGYEYGIATDLKIIGIHSLDESIDLGINKLTEAINILKRIKNSREAQALSELVTEIRKDQHK